MTRTHTGLEKGNAVETKRISKTSPVLNLVALVCLIGGAVGALKATEMQRAGDAVLFLFMSISVSCFVCYLYFKND